jgi:hypothetical protein
MNFSPGSMSSRVVRASTRHHDSGREIGGRARLAAPRHARDARAD